MRAQTPLQPHGAGEAFPSPPPSNGDTRPAAWLHRGLWWGFLGQRNLSSPLPWGHPKGASAVMGVPRITPRSLPCVGRQPTPPAKATTAPVRQRINIVLEKILLEALTTQNQAAENHLQLPRRRERDGKLARDRRGAHPRGQRSWDAASWGPEPAAPAKGEQLPPSSVPPAPGTESSPAAAADSTHPIAGLSRTELAPGCC